MDADKVAQLERILPEQDVAGQNGIVSHLAKIVFACGQVVRGVMEPGQSVWECAACLADAMDTTAWPAQMVASTRMQSWWNSSLSIQRMMISAWLRVEPPASPSATAVPLLQLEAQQPPAGAVGARMEKPPTGPAPADGATTSQAPDSAQGPGPTTGNGGGPPTVASGAATVLQAVPLSHGTPVVGNAPVGTTSTLTATSTGGTDAGAAQARDRTADVAVPPLPPPPPCRPTPPVACSWCGVSGDPVVTCIACAGRRHEKVGRWEG